MVAHPPNRVGESGVVGRVGASLPRGDDLARVEGEAREDAETAAPTPLALRSKRTGRVLQEGDADRQPFDARRPAEEIDGDDRPRLRADRDSLRVEVHRLGVDVDEHRLGTGKRDDVGGRRKRVRGDEHLVAGTDPEGEDREVKRGRPRRDDDGVLGAAGRGEAAFELGDLRAHGQLPALEHFGDGLGFSGADIRPGEAD